MTVIAIRSLTIRFGGRTLLDNADLMLDAGRKIGLVGRNGAGKSTMLKAITGELQPDGGEIRLAQRAKLGVVAQEAPGGRPPCWTACWKRIPSATACSRRSRTRPRPTGSRTFTKDPSITARTAPRRGPPSSCLLYPSDAAEEERGVKLSGPQINEKKNNV